MTNNIDSSNSHTTRNAQFLNLVLIWGLAVSSSILGSIVITILGYMLAKANYPNPSEWSAELLGAGFGMVLSIPLGSLCGGLAGTAILSMRGYSQRPTRNASIVACLAGALFSGVVLVPTGFIMFILEHI
jgi:hypothetical protein